MNLDVFRDATAARLEPDRAERWLAYWETFSSTIPDAVPDTEYSDLALGAWIDFRTLDEGEQIEAISRAWGIKQFNKLKPKPSRAARAEPTATVVRAKKWEPCTHWGGTRPCSEHGHVTDAGQMRRAESLYEIHADFVRKRVNVEVLPWTNGKRYEHAIDVEAQVWYNVARGIKSYLPMMDSRGEEIPAATRKWLCTVTHTTVLEYFRGKYRDKRDIRKEVQLVDDRGILNPSDLPACSTPTAMDPEETGDETTQPWIDC